MNDGGDGADDRAEGSSWGADDRTGESLDEIDGDPLEDLDTSEHPVLLFDGVCNLCNAAVRFVVRFDRAGTFRFAPLQSAVGRALLERHGVDAGEFDSFVLVEGEEAYEKSTAALRVARRLDGPWPLLGPLAFVPRGLRDAAYDLVADNRYRAFGRTDECQLPPPELRERFAERALDELDGDR